MATIVQFERPTQPPDVDSIHQAFEALRIATAALAEIADYSLLGSGYARADRAMQALRDIKQVSVG
jgi:hypothetical protein